MINEATNAGMVVPSIADQNTFQLIDISISEA
jgi:hypothetical protein